MSDQGAPLKPFGRDELVERVVLKHRIAKRAAERIIDVVLDEVLRQVTPVIEREWSGNEVVRRIRGLRSPTESRQTRDVGTGATNEGNL